MKRMEMPKNFDDPRVEAFLSPLARIAPAARRPRPPVRVRRLALVALGLVAITGVAVAATRNSHHGPLHHVIATPNPSPLTCSGIIGKSPKHAAAYLSAHGYKVSWRFETSAGHALSKPHGTQPGAVEGYSKTVAKPPAGTVVSDVAPTDTPKYVVVFTQARSDPNAERIVPPKCARED
jgi:hypothetical protein